MFRIVQKIIEQQNMILPGDKVVVGLSGGADSVALLLVLKELEKVLGFSLEAIHVEHGIRGEESKSDEAFAKTLCESQGIPFASVTVDVPAFCKETGLGMEEAARKLRYEVFEKLALEKDAKVALAHHQEDNAETILFQLVRGSSLTGLCGMQPVRNDENGVCYIRPLLGVHREEIENYLKERGQEYCIDSTNTDLVYSRNFLRNQVIPELAQINAQAVAHINQTANHLSEIKAYMDAEVDKYWNQLAEETPQGVEICLTEFAKLPVVLQRELIYKAIVHAAKQKKDISSVHVEDVLSICNGQSGKSVALPYGLRACREFDLIRVYNVQTEIEKSVETEREFFVSGAELENCRNTKETIRICFGEENDAITLRIIENEKESLEIPRKTYTKWMDYDKIKQGFCIRTRRSGDFFISDTAGHKKKLKQYFIDEKIPQAARDKMWLLAQGQEVLWLLGGRISEHIKVTHETKYMVEITYDGGQENE